LNPYQCRAWLYQVLKNRFIDLSRSYRRRQDLLQKLAVMVSTDERSTAYAGEVTLFERLPERYRDLLVKRYVLGYTSDEMAQEYHVPAATVRSRIRLALQWLRANPDEWT
jgi:RNA polymerase sigma-70 factor, ECF subfamily